MKTSVFILILGIVTSTLSPFASAGEPSIPVGAARVDITPDYPVRLTGYVVRQVESEGIEQHVFARALAIGDADSGGPVVLVAVETCAFSAEMADEVAKRLETKAGLPRERFVLCATHTHTAPALTNVLPLIFGEPVPPEHQARIDRYTKELTDRIEQAALAAIADRRPSRIAWGRGSVGFANNRRTIKDGKWVGFGINPEAPTDHSLPMLRVTDLDGRVRAVLAGYACHCTALDGTDNRICGDWAGYASAAIEREQPDAVGLIIIGCAGDANPFERGHFPAARKQGEQLAAEVLRLLGTDLKPLAGPITCRFRRISLPFDTPPTRDEWIERTKGQRVVALHARLNLARLDRGETLPTAIDYPVQSWCFGNDLAFVFLGGEVVVDYAIRLRRELDARRLWIAAYANDVPCYIPSRRLLREGGYEVDRSMSSYDRPTRLAPAVEELVIDAVHSVLPEAFAAPSHRNRPNAPH